MERGRGQILFVGFAFIVVKGLIFGSSGNSGGEPPPPLPPPESGGRFGKGAGKCPRLQPSFCPPPKRLPSAGDPRQRATAAGCPFSTYSFWAGKKSKALPGGNLGSLRPLRPVPPGRASSISCSSKKRKQRKDAPARAPWRVPSLRPFHPAGTKTRPAGFGHPSPKAPDEKRSAQRSCRGMGGSQIFPEEPYFEAARCTRRRRLRRPLGEKSPVWTISIAAESACWGEIVENCFISPRRSLPPVSSKAAEIA